MINFGTIPWVARLTPSGGGGGASLVASGTAGFTFGSSRNMTIPVGAAAGDRIVLIFDAGATVTSVTDAQSTVYSAPTIASMRTEDRVYISAPLGGTIPTSLTIAFSGNTPVDKSDIYIIRGSSGTVTGDGSFSTGFGPDPRTHAYTTSAANNFVFGVIDFPGGGATGATGQDAEHTWLLNSSGAFRHSFGVVRPTAGSYNATLGPVGASSASNGFWFRLS